MDVHALKNEGWTSKEIAAELGFHPATVAKWLNAGGPPERETLAGRLRLKPPKTRTKSGC